MTDEGISAQGEGSAGRPLADLSRGATSWRQVGLVPEVVLQARLDLGWHSVERVGMWAIEVRNPITAELVAAEVSPAHTYTDVLSMLIAATSTQRLILLEYFDPDPFA